MRFGGLEIVALLALVFLFYGPRQLPKLADAFKKSKHIVKDADGTGEAEEGTDAEK